MFWEDCVPNVSQQNQHEDKMAASLLLDIISNCLWFGIDIVQLFIIEQVIHGIIRSIYN